MSGISGFLRTIGAAMAGSVIGRIKTMWLIVGLGGTLGAAWMVGMQAVAALTFTPAVATIAWAGYVCEAAPGQTPMSACSEAETERRRAANSPLKHEYRVRFSFTDPAKTERFTISGYLPLTGLPRDEAVKGARFNLLYDPTNPKKTSLPLGSDYHALLIGLVGIAALGSYAAIFWMSGSAARRRRDDRLDALTNEVMSRYRA